MTHHPGQEANPVNKLEMWTKIEQAATKGPWTQDGEHTYIQGPQHYLADVRLDKDRAFILVSREAMPLLLELARAVKAHRENGAILTNTIVTILNSLTQPPATKEER
jgi:hypothetical protein